MYESRLMKSIAPSALTLASDGYVRLSMATLQSLPLTHLISALDEYDGETHAGEGATAAFICGYTEWVSNTVPVVSIGWDWQLQCLSPKTTFMRVGEPRSNVMLTDPSGRDIGAEKTATWLEIIIDELEWQGEVDRAIRTRYA